LKVESGHSLKFQITGLFCCWFGCYQGAFLPFYILSFIIEYKVLMNK